MPARRQFLRGVVAATGLAAVLPALRSLGLLASRGRVHAASGGYGPLAPTADLRDGVRRLALPRGFQYRSLSVSGEVMSDGQRVPLAMDGMAAFTVEGGRFRLVRNHEDRNEPGQGSTAVDANAYDSRGGGGTTTLVVNPFTREVERHFISLNGTIVNCAGGPTPWETWITCEETNAGPSSGWLEQHGYCFEVPVAANGTVPAVPIRSMGRFSHEAVAVDPKTWIVYETEDSGGSSGFYRFVPTTRGVLAKGGTLEMLAVDGRPGYDTRVKQSVGTAMPVRWVTITNQNPQGTGANAVFSQGAAQGGARFARLEGCWWGNGAVYFTATSGGDAGRGQVWELRPDGDRGTLTLIFESAGSSQLDSPDNLTVSPQGALLLCEDGGGNDYLRGVTLNGEIFDFGANLETNHEWAGATFVEADPGWNDPAIRGTNKPFGDRWDRVTLFVNRQGATSGRTPPPAGEEGMTFAIWGPWGEGAL